MIIENGKRVQVVFGEGRGEVRAEAGLRVVGDTWELAFTAPLGRLGRVESGTVDGEAVRVLSVAESAYVTGMVVMVVKAVQAP